MATKYKLTYFDVEGLGEPIRFLLSYGKLDFEDVRIAIDDWPSVKKTFPMGQVPVLEVDGKVLFQTIAICRYLGGILGIAGANPLENQQIDAAVDSFTDFRIKFANYRYEKDEAKKAILKEDIKKETIPFYFSKFDGWVQENGGYVVLGKLTWADIITAALLGVYNDFCTEAFGESILNQYPALEGLVDKVHNLPGVAEWVAKRPKKA